MSVPYKNRIEAGQELAKALDRYRKRTDLLVLGLPRGGVPVAAEVAKALGAPLDVVVVRKLGTPGQEELAMGAIATGGARVMNRDVVDGLRIDPEAVERVAERERTELARREREYRGDRPQPSMKSRCLILVDDGLATGATMRAAVRALRQHDPALIVVAVPVAPLDTVRRLEQEADDVICLEAPSPFWGVGQWYEDFSQVSDAEVRRLLDAFEPSTGGEGS